MSFQRPSHIQAALGQDGGIKYKINKKYSLILI
jgi:hypothetical protein